MNYYDRPDNGSFPHRKNMACAEDDGALSLSVFFGGSAEDGCYIPFDWADDFEPAYLENIRCRCLVMSEKYIRNHFDDICKNADIIEQRKVTDECTMEEIIEDNEAVLSAVRKYGLPCTLIDDRYDVGTEL